MVKNMFYVLVAVIVISFSWITITVLTNEDEIFRRNKGE